MFLEGCVRCSRLICVMILLARQCLNRNTKEPSLILFSNEFNFIEFILLFDLPPLCLSLLLYVRVAMRISTYPIKRHPDIQIRSKKQRMISLSIMRILKKSSTLKLIQLLNIFYILSLLNIY